jgi:hypothetical protein
MRAAASGHAAEKRQGEGEMAEHRDLEHLRGNR